MIRNMYLGGLFLCCVTTIVFALPSHRGAKAIVKKTYVSDIVDGHGNVHIVYNDGQDIQVTKDGYNTHPRIAPDRKTVGWQHGEYADQHGVKTYFDVSIIFYRNGHTVGKFGPLQVASIIGEWKFRRNGEDIAVETYGMHGFHRYRLWNIASRKTLAQWNDYQKNPPQWAMEIGGTPPRD